ncbi:MAG: flagellar export protein FliJ [Lachnospiraceae bacterium]|nr:flagellar export protein FliJ [Lachnospiraceae bacterium]
MAKFFYKMQNILDIKLKLETQARNEYAIANATLAEEEEKLSELERRRQGYEERLEELYSDRLDLKEINETAQAVEIIKYHKRLQEENVRLARKKSEDAREKLKEAIKERKTHEKLKENAFEEFRIEIAAAESKEIDELVSYRHGQDDGSDPEYDNP